ncbi:putative transcriptional regulator, IclR family protein [Gordonia crocea]|uniref:Putative transcriptional regulator, IclR family protein n=1 Tax=Gordonia crocea TaxID=589162 RepID=A0A7I9UUL2_9ACTN|nr:putative transcriptional regulator, IclR family protein [Gordonia crocea]
MAVVDAVVDAVTRDPERKITLADIVRDTGLSRATTHAIVAELVDLGWLRRDDDGIITLGTGLLATATRVLGADRLTTAARPILSDLADAVRAPVFLARRIDDSRVTVVEYLWPQRSSAKTPPDLPAGRRIALRPPICREFLAWEPPAVQEAWIELAPDADRARLRLVLPAVAERGYSIERVADEHRAVIDALTTMSSVPASLRHRVGALVSELSVIDYLPGELVGEVGAVTVGAPVFDGERVIASVVACPNTTMSADELAHIGAATVAAAALLKESP